MPSISATIQKSILSLLLSRLPIHLSSQEESLISLSTGIHLANLTLDEEKLQRQLPQHVKFHIRSAQIDQLDINVSTDGIKAKVKGLKCIISPRIGMNVDSQEGIDEVVQSVLGLVDAVAGTSISTSDFEEEYLDNIADEDENAENDEIIQSMIESKAIPEDHRNTKDTWSGYVISYILSKVKVNIEDVHVKIMADPLILFIVINRIYLETENGQRKCDIESFKIGLAPNEMPSDNGDTDNGQEHTEYSSNASSDYDDDMMASSFMAESKDQIHQSLKESITHKQGSLYMSTDNSEFFDAESHIASSYQPTQETLNQNSSFLVGSLIFILDSVSLNMDTTTQDVKIQIGIIKVSLVPLPEFLSSFLTLVLQLNKQSRHHLAEHSKIYDKGTKMHNDFRISNFTLDALDIGLSSTLNEEGKFDDEKSIMMSLMNLSIQQKGKAFFQGSLRDLQIIENTQHILIFDSEKIAHADIKFEIQDIGKLRTISIICSNTLKLNLGIDAIKEIVSFVFKLDDVFEKLSILSDTTKDKNLRMPSFKNNTNISTSECKRRTEFTFESSGINCALVVNDKESLIINTAGISFDSLKGVFDVGEIDLIYISQNIEHILATIGEINFTNYGKKSVSVKGYDINTQKKITLNSHSVLHVGPIVLKFTVDIVQSLTDYVLKLRKVLHRNDRKKTVQFANNKARRMHTSFLMKKNMLKFYANVKSLSFEALNIKQDFGNLCGQLHDISFYQYTDSTQNGYIEEVEVSRVFKIISQTLITRINNLHLSAPAVFFKIQPDLKTLYLNALSLEYYGEWLKIFDQSGLDKYEPPLGTGIDISNLGNDIKKKMFQSFFISFNNFIVGLAPVNLKSKAYIVLKKATCDFVLYDDRTITCQNTIDSLGLYLIDDTKIIKPLRKNKLWTVGSVLKQQGFVKIGTTNLLALKIDISTVESLMRSKSNSQKALVDAFLNTNDFELRICSDSLHCLVNLLKDLKQPIFFSFDDKYRFKLDSPIDVFKHINNDMFVLKNKDQHAKAGKKTKAIFEDEVPHNEINFDDHFYDSLEFEKADKDRVHIIPFKMNLNISRIHILLHDGYDWKETRDQISQAVLRVSEKVQNRNCRDEEDESLIYEETLYQSIYLGLHISGTEGDLVENINKKIGDEGGEDYDEEDEDDVYGNDNENEVIARRTTVALGKSRSVPLRLKRSKYHKVSIELDETNVSFELMSSNEPHLIKNRPNVFGDHSEVVQSINIGVKKFQIIDNVPTSNWNMFVGYLREAGDVEIGKEMINIDIKMIRPIARLAAIDLILNINILPLRLHVDQDTLDFLLRFGEFKDQRFVPPNLDNDELFISKFSINAIQLKLDYKPKTIDYAGIRSGHTGEFVNLFVLDESRMMLNQITLYGIYGISKLNTLLNGVWSPDIKKNQLIDVLSGLAFIRSIVNIGQGAEKLVSVPIEDYRRDGRFFRGVQRGVYIFGKTTGREVLKLGAKLAVGTQGILESAEEVLGGTGPQRISKSAEDQDDNIFESEEEEEEDFGDDESNEPEEQRVVSLYSNQPGTFNEGLQVAYESVGKNFSTMRKAIVQASSKANESRNMSGAVGELVKAAPIVIIRPLVATTEAISKTLMGGVNELDPEQKLHNEEKYK